MGLTAAGRCLARGLRRAAFSVLSALPRPLVGTLARWFIQSDRRRWVHAAVSKLVRASEVTVPRGALAGLRLVAAGSSAGYLLGVTEPAVQEALSERLRSGMSFYDVGANVGFFTVLAARLVGPAGRVYAWEPLPGNVAVLRRNLALNGFGNVVVQECAASNESRRGRMEGRDGVVASLSPGSLRGEGMGTEVEVVAIDALVDDGRVEPPDVVKIDVEGHEPEVIEGMGATLRRWRPVVIFEVHDAEGAARAARLLERAGYELTPLSDPPGAMPHLLAVPRGEGR